MSFSLESALRKANDLEDKNLCAALQVQLAEWDQQWEALLRPLPAARNTADVPSNEGSRHHTMCPDLYRATLSGSVSVVKELLSSTGDIVHTNDVEETEVKVFLEDVITETKRSNKHWGGRVRGDSQCMLQETTAEKNTVLHIAAEQGHVELVELFIRRDNTLMVSENSRHETPLHLAARAGNSRMVSLIILLAQESGIGAHKVLTKKSLNGETALHEAARHGHEDVMKVLMIAAPALSAEVNNASMSPLYLAVVRKSIGVVKALLQHTHASAVGPNQQNALHAAVLGSHDLASMLLDWKAELANERDASGSTPLHYAASSGDVTVLEKMLNEMPWAVYIQDQEGSSPLHVAARMHSYKSIHRMIEHCPDSFELRDKHGRNFLHILAQHGGEEINLNRRDLKKFISMIKFISGSPDLKRLVHERDNDGNTPLHFASENGFSEVILQLLEKTEADTMLMNNEGKTALDLAVAPSISFNVMVSTVATLSSYGAIFSPRRQDKLQNWTDNTTKWIDKVSKDLIVVSALIATVAFSAAFNVPGSYDNDGLANFREKTRFQIFLVLDAIAMSTSVTAAILLVVAKAVGKTGSWISFSRSLYLLWISLFAMELAFVTAIAVSLGAGSFGSRGITKFIITAISVCFFSWTLTTLQKICSPIKLPTLMRFLYSARKQTQTARQIDMQCPKLTSYVRLSRWFISLNMFLYIVTFAIMGIMWRATRVKELTL